MPTFQLIKYWGGMFRLRIENLPESMQSDKELQNEILQLLAAKYAFYDWGNTLPADRLTEMNSYLYSLIESYY